MKLISTESLTVLISLATLIFAALAKHFSKKGKVAEDVVIEMGDLVTATLKAMLDRKITANEWKNISKELSDLVGAVERLKARVD